MTIATSSTNWIVKPLGIIKENNVRHPRKERSRGAGIGLIQVALTSRNPIYFTHKKLDNHVLLLFIDYQS